jgi:hypothetical protein
MAVSWSGPDPKNPSSTIQNRDENVEMWFGVSPAPKNPQIAFTDPFPNHPTNVNSADWAAKNVWSGLVLDKFFATAKASSRYVKIQMYEPNLDAADPSSGSPKSWLTFVPYAMMDYIKSNPGNSLEILTGFLQEPGSPDPKTVTPTYWPAGPAYDSQNDLLKTWFTGQIESPSSKEFSLTLDQKRQFFFRSYFANANNQQWPYAHYCNASGNACADYKDCQVCGSSVCCKAHDKLYISEVGVNFSSGQWAKEYYNDPKWLNDDLLLLNPTPSTTFTFASYWSDWFNVLYSTSSLPPDQNPNRQYPEYLRTDPAPPAFDCTTLANNPELGLNTGIDPLTLNCYPNFPTIYSTEDIYASTSYGSWDPVIVCPNGKLPQFGSGPSENLKLFCSS